MRLTVGRISGHAARDRLVRKYWDTESRCSTQTRAPRRAGSRLPSSRRARTVRRRWYEFAARKPTHPPRIWCGKIGGHTAIKSRRQSSTHTARHANRGLPRALRDRRKRDPRAQSTPCAPRPPPPPPRPRGRFSEIITRAPASRPHEPALWASCQLMLHRERICPRHPARRTHRCAARAVIEPRRAYLSPGSSGGRSGSGACSVSFGSASST